MIFTQSSSPGVTTCSGASTSVHGHLGDVDETLECSVADLGTEGTERHELRHAPVDELAHLVAVGELLPRGSCCVALGSDSGMRSRSRGRRRAPAR